MGRVIWDDNLGKFNYADLMASAEYDDFFQAIIEDDSASLEDLIQGCSDEDDLQCKFGEDVFRIAFERGSFKCLKALLVLVDVDLDTYDGNTKVDDDIRALLVEYKIVQERAALEPVDVEPKLQRARM